MNVADDAKTRREAAALLKEKLRLHKKYGTPPKRDERDKGPVEGSDEWYESNPNDPNQWEDRQRELQKKNPWI